MNLADAWKDVVVSTRRERADVFDGMGVFGGDENYRVRMDFDLVVVVPVKPNLKLLRRDVRSGHTEHLNINEDDLERLLVRHIAYAATVPPADRCDWQTTRARIAAEASMAVVAVSVIGLSSSAVDSEGFSAPLHIGERLVAGDLDATLAESLDALARNAGLPGFHLSDEAWWTEDYLAAIEEPDIGAELLDDYASRRAEPPFVVGVRVAAAGTVAEDLALARIEAFVGAALLSVRRPGEPWPTKFPPQLCDRRDEERPDIRLPSAQRVDLTNHHPTRARSDYYAILGPREEAERPVGAPAVDAASPASRFGDRLMAVVASELHVSPVTSACLLVAKAVRAATEADRLIIATSAYDLLVQNGLATAGQAPNSSDAALDAVQEALALAAKS